MERHAHGGDLGDRAHEPPQEAEAARSEEARRPGAELTAAELTAAELTASYPRIGQAFARLESLPIFFAAQDRVASYLAGAASPERAMLALEDSIRSLEASRGDASPLLVDPILRLVIELAGASGRAARLLSRDPALAIELALRNRVRQERGDPDHKERLSRIATVSAGDTAKFDRLIRRYRHRQMLAIALKELREGDVRETAAELGDLAAAALESALLHHLPLVRDQFGKPDPECEQVIIGMGKLGGRELNFSSDIDVIYFYEHDEGRAGEITLHQFFTKLFERVTVSIAANTEHGFVFRVDLDLRPEGKTGAIANSLQSAERYYESWGRTWERQAWVRGRPIAGSEKLGARVIAMMRPFVYRRSFDLRAIEEIFAMKTKIDGARKRAGLKAMSIDLKLQEGGIREIEFFAQALQLLYGGRDPTLRQTNTLEALIRLEAGGVISMGTRELLADAYLFLRKVEHRVQIVEEQQTHALPSNPEDARAVARSLGFQSVDALVEALGRHMREVHELFVLRIGRGEEEQPIAPSIEVIMDRSAPEKERLDALAQAEVRDPHAALANLDRAAMHPQSPFHNHAAAPRRLLAARLLDECLTSPNADRALRHLPDLIRSLVLHGSYIEGLERPRLRRGVARVLGASDMLARILVTNPALLPNVLLEEKLPEEAAIARDLEARLQEAKGDIEDELVILRTVKQEEILRTAMADLADLIHVTEVGHRLSRLAELLIRASLDRALKEMTARYGEPRRPDGAAAEIAIIAGGTLGANEMGYRSDVDLAMIYEGEGGETTGGERPPISVSEFYTRASQRLLSFLTMKMLEGDLYPVDTRLRPSGSKGALVASLESFETYHQKTAQLWERQALVRSRTVAGSPPLRAKLDLAIQRAAYDTGPAEEASKKIHEMRVRMERERSQPMRRRYFPSGAKPAPRPEVLDLKLGRGGLVEAEFLVQYLLIQHGRDHPEIRATSTVDALGRLQENRLLDLARARRLIDAVERLRAVQNWLRLAHDAMIDHVDLAPETLRPLALAVGYQGESAQDLLRRDLVSDTAGIHLCYTEVLGQPS